MKLCLKLRFPQAVTCNAMAGDGLLMDKDEDEDALGFFYSSFMFNISMAWLFLGLPFTRVYFWKSKKKEKI